MSKKHILSITDLTQSEICYLVDKTLKIAEGQMKENKPLAGKTVGIYFQKTSTRTRTSFTVGATKLGANIIAYGPDELQINTGETLEDTSRVLSCYLDALVIRTTESTEINMMANQDRMSIINGMTKNEHPTQALADLSSIKQYFGHLEGLNILYLGEGNTTAAALALAMSKIQGMRLTLLTPEYYGLSRNILNQSKEFANEYNSCIEEFHSLEKLPKHVDVVYTTRWQTTGTSKADPNWRNSFKPFSVTQSLMTEVSKPTGTIFMHDLPAARGEDVEKEVIDGPQSIVFQQACNKLYSAMAVLEWCILGVQ